jgi:hypothetical protein
MTDVKFGFLNLLDDIASSKTTYEKNAEWGCLMMHKTLSIDAALHYFELYSYSRISIAKKRSLHNSGPNIDPNN